METVHPTIFFKTPAAAAVFVGEVQGQISDGMWENSRPYDHWKFWSSSNAKISNEKFGYMYGNDGNFIMKNNYGITRLNKYVFDRIENFVKTAKSKYFTERIFSSGAFEILADIWLFSYSTDDNYYQSKMREIFKPEESFPENQYARGYFIGVRDALAEEGITNPEELRKAALEIKETSVKKSEILAAENEIKMAMKTAA